MSKLAHSNATTMTALEIDKLFEEGISDPRDIPMNSHDLVSLHMRGALTNRVSRWLAEKHPRFVFMYDLRNNDLIADHFAKYRVEGTCCGHASSCAVHNEPAYPVGPCSCGYSEWVDEQIDLLMKRPA